MTPRILAAALALIPAPTLAETPIPGIDGTWESMACELRPQQGPDGVADWWVTRKITFADSTITAEFTTYAGPGCTTPLNIRAFAGRVDVLGDSDVSPTAKEADLTIDQYVRITPMAQGFADFLNSQPGACGSETWEVGKEIAVHETGCALLGVEPDTPTIEYEILAVEGDHLYFGARPVDGRFLANPEQRPKALLVPAKRVN